MFSRSKTLTVAGLLFFYSVINVHSTGGITPEQIYQANMDAQAVIGSWEKLPEENPLAEKPGSFTDSSFRTLMTFRKDGTCRIFSEAHPTGVDGVWSFEEHKIFVTLPNKAKIDFYVYGVKGDFMITRSREKNGSDQLWSRVK